jgi:peptidase E
MDMLVSGKKLKKYAATFFFKFKSIYHFIQITITTTSQQMRLNIQQQLEVVGLWLPVCDYLYVIIGSDFTSPK